MKQYSVRQLAKMAGVSVRTLHLYDQVGLLKPSVRTEAKYRMYGEKELFRLQQILFYKELDFSLQAIKSILDKPDFDLVQALESHKTELQNRQSRIADLLLTIDKTMLKLKGEIMLTHEELYEGFPNEKAEAYRKEAIAAYGKEPVEKSENHLRAAGKKGFETLKAEQQEITQTLLSLMKEDPKSVRVQEQIACHYANIRQFWGTAGTADPQAEAYSGLGELYVNDERFTTIDGKPNPDYAHFMRDAMRFFAETHLT
ncbi:MerR family transcriptional regulator [Runella sp.]|uniref:MerR family transcriptional regulator n=1 Tax=Runella sp. TaxID=1960881 RepID=UPI003D0B1250